MFRVTLLFCILAFFILRPFEIQRYGLLTPGDDSSYFAYATMLVYGQYPFFQKEFCDEASAPPLRRIGVGLMVAPFVGVFSIVDRLNHHPIVEKRTRETITSSWSLFGAVFAAVFYLWFACFYLYRSLLYFFPSTLCSLSVFLMVLCQGALLHALRRPLFSHIHELFLQSLLFFLFIQKQISPKKQSWIKNWTGLITISFLGSLVFLVRANNLVYAIAWPIFILGFESFSFQKKQWKRILLSLGICFGLAYLIKNLPLLYSQDSKNLYLSVSKRFENPSFLFEFESVSFYTKKFFHILVGWDWGLIFTAPYLILGFLGLRHLSNPIRKVSLLLVIPLIVNLYVLLIWGGNGGWYGYRYFIFSAMPVLILPFTQLLQSLQQQNLWFYRVCMGWAIFPFLSMLMFEGSDKLVLHSISSQWGDGSWGHLTYQLEVWKSVLVAPRDFLYNLIKAGPAYVIYVLSHLFGMTDQLPAKIFQGYPTFEWAVFLKTLLIFILPFSLLRLLGHESKKS